MLTIVATTTSLVTSIIHQFYDKLCDVNFVFDQCPSLLVPLRFRVGFRNRNGLSVARFRPMSRREAVPRSAAL